MLSIIKEQTVRAFGYTGFPENDRKLFYFSFYFNVWFVGST